MVETKCILNIVEELKIVEWLDGRKVHSSDLFNQVWGKLNEAAINRSTDQIKEPSEGAEEWKL